MKRASKFFVGLTGISCFCSAATHAKPREIYVETDMSAIGQNRPLENLVAALKKHPKQRRFRTVWWTSGSSRMDTHTVALYDRQRQTK